MLRDFSCNSCSYTEERYVDSETTLLPCPKCYGDMERLIGMPKISLDGTDSGFPGAYDRWARIREDNARIKAKRSE